ncbi:MAG: hypothetical protein IJH92_03935 [Mogibacterium sp.]|nr:hypothetical protein [Mogibacterium sp.]
MDVFKIMLIILIALPVVALSIYLYFQTVVYIRAKNLEDRERQADERRTGRRR